MNNENKLKRLRLRQVRRAAEIVTLVLMIITLVMRLTGTLETLGGLTVNLFIIALSTIIGIMDICMEDAKKLFIHDIWLAAWGFIVIVNIFRL